MRKVLALVFLAITIGVVSEISAQTTEFIYQGGLKDNAVAANGNYDLEFALFDAVNGGTQLGSTLSRNNVVVANGIFSVSLDFGSQFPGALRFLEIRVRLAGQPSFTTLGPRQPVNTAPYSVKSLNSTNADVATNATQLGGVAANQYVVTTDSRMTDARPPAAGSSNYIQNSTSPQASSNFNISGTGRASTLSALVQYNLGVDRILSNPGTDNLFAGVGAGTNNTIGNSNAFFGSNAGSLNTSGLRNSFFGANAGQNNSTGFRDTFFGSGAGNLNTSGSANSFFGDNAGLSNTTGASNAFFGRGAGLGNTVGINNSYFGANAGQNGSNGINNAFFGDSAGVLNTTGKNNAFFGAQTGSNNSIGNFNTAIGTAADFGGDLTNATAIGSRARVDQNNSLVLGSINGVNGATADTNVGIGTTAPSEKLHVVGNGLFTGNVTVNGSLSATLGQAVNTVYGTAQIVVGPSTVSYVLIPGLTQTVNVPANSVVHITTDGGIQNVSASSSTFAAVDLGIFIDGAISTQAGQRRIIVANTPAIAQMIATWSIARSISLSAGMHTIEVKAVGVDPSSVDANVSSGSAPQLQGQLTVIIVKQ